MESSALIPLPSYWNISRHAMCHYRCGVSSTLFREAMPTVRPRTAAAAVGRGLSQISHGLTGRRWTMTSMPDTDQDADVRIGIPAHWPDTFH